MTALNFALIQLAAQAKPATKVAAKAALKAAGLQQTLADDLLAEVDALKTLKLHAPADRLARHLGYCPVSAKSGRFTHVVNGRVPNGIALRDIQATPGRKPVRLPAGTPASRLADLRISAVLAVYRRAYREAAHGEVHIRLTNDPAGVGVKQTESLDWNLYRGKHKGKPARVQDTTVTVPTDWRVRVERRGLAQVDGMLTIDAAPVEASGCELFAAAWLVQGRGTSVTVARGYIARSGRISYHAATIDQALSGIARKSRALGLTAMLATVDLSALVAKCPGLRVSVADARLIGACEYGIKSWCNAVGLDYEAGEAALADVYAAYQREPRAEARAAILHALRRARKLVAQ